MGLILLCGCSTSHMAIQTTQMQVVDTPVVYRQSIFNSTNLKNILFYNNKEIKLQKKFVKQIVSIENGKVIQTDSLNNVSKIVEKMTPGSIINIDSTKIGDINLVNVLFSKEDYSYSFTFQKMRDGSFNLYGKGKIIFNGRKYTVDAITDGECKLMFYFKKNEVKTETNEIANGIKLNE